MISGKSASSICNCKSVHRFLAVRINILKGQSHEKVGESRVWRGSLGPN
jgi:hypothetical protein